MTDQDCTVTVKLDGAWSRSMVEEVIAVLWAMAAILCFGFDFNIAGWGFAIKAAFDTAISIRAAFVEIVREKKEQASNES
jgi:hypothetical protein